MAFINRDNATQCGNDFVCKLSVGYYPKDYLTNHGEDFTGGYEDLTRIAFVQFINSASYALMQLRRPGYQCEEYHGY